MSLAAWQAQVDRAHVKPGQKVLVHAGSGGLGSTAIQLAKHLGATVATTARGKNADLVRSLRLDGAGRGEGDGGRQAGAQQLPGPVAGPFPVARLLAPGAAQLPQSTRVASSGRRAFRGGIRARFSY